MIYTPPPRRPTRLAHRAIALALGVLSFAALLAATVLFVAAVALVLP